MAQRIGWVFLGVVLAFVLLIVGGYAFVAAGGVPMAASSSPLPLEKTVARLALHASYKHSVDQKNPLPLNDANLVAGAAVYNGTCALCHGALDQRRPDIAAGMFPEAPPLLAPDGMVTDDPEGVTYWKVTNGIRLSGMPGFARTLSDTKRWQVTMLLAHADKLTPAARKELLGPQ
ncbi:MAG TPA: c-type cytochrome [Vicinamibacterales bacterium]|jgi:mono/diheme cytochrome c family protein|nr:c-type cytochrome [Vicinamibacterales bacterium]